MASRLALAICALIALGVSPTVASGPDFAHPASPHYPDYQPTAGANSRPILVIYEEFSDLPTPPGRGQSWLSHRIFGPAYPNVVGYYEARSFGHVSFWPAYDTCASGDGTGGDGVVLVQSGTRASWNALTDGQRIRDALVAADDCVDYATFDRNGDRVIDMQELAVIKVEVQPGDDGFGTGGGAASRYTDNGSRLDGVSLDGMLVGLANSATNMMSVIHEVMHVAFGMPRDWYQFGIDGYDVMAATISDAEFLEGVSSWNAMHLGWTRPTVITRDGYYDLPSYGRTGQAILLYDPAKGRRDYLLVENRTLTPGSYDEDPAAMRGLNVWRVDESRYYEDPASASPIARIRPCGNATCPDGWYFSTFDGDSRTFPARTVTPRWNDGTRARVAIRAIGAAGPSMRAFYDVPGPGVLVDCFSASGNGNRATYTVSAGTRLVIGQRLMNTGDATGRFDVRAIRRPSGWRVTNQARLPLRQHRAASTAVSVDVPRGTRAGMYVVRLEARSSGDHAVRSTCSVNVRVR
ncbi:MAG: hypothetical protein LH650_00275 [Chloroflexi bacterium]|nr:hypothetical protein [Chloroflexota bacterium]